MGVPATRESWLELGAPWSPLAPPCLPKCTFRDAESAIRKTRASGELESLELGAAGTGSPLDAPWGLGAPFIAVEMLLKSSLDLDLVESRYR